MPNMLKLVLENQVKFLIIKIVLEIPQKKNTYYMK